MANKTLLLVLALALCVFAMAEKRADRPLIGSSEFSIHPKYRSSTTHRPPPGIPAIGSDPASLPPKDRVRDFVVVGPGGIHNPDAYREE